MIVEQYLFQNQKVFFLIQKFPHLPTHMHMLSYIHGSNLYIFLY